MFLAMLLAAQAAITPAQSAAADKVAVAYLTQACADGNERYGVVTVADGVLHDLSQNGTRYTVTIDEKAFRELCTQDPLIAYHCHPTNDPLSLFPGLGMDGQSSDFGTVAFLEFMCAEEGTAPVIEHRIVHTGGGSGTVVQFGLRGVPLERTRGLGRQMSEVIPQEPGPVDRHGFADMSEMMRAPARIRGIHEGLRELYAAIHESYGREVLGFLKKTCPGATSEEALRECEAFSLSAYIATTEPCGDRFIVLPGAGLRECAVATGERIRFGDSYPGWTELTPENYDAFTGSGRVALAFCDDSSTSVGRSCTTVLDELKQKLPTCAQLKRGYVDVSRNNHLRQRHEVGFREVAFLEGGRRYNITVKNPSAEVFTGIVCGVEAMFGGFFAGR